jgi:hypothetical protein
MLSSHVGLKYVIISPKVVTVAFLGLNSNLGPGLSRKLLDYDDMASLIINTGAQWCNWECINVY